MSTIRIGYVGQFKWIGDSDEWIDGTEMHETRHDAVNYLRHHMAAFNARKNDYECFRKGLKCARIILRTIRDSAYTYPLLPELVDTRQQATGDDGTTKEQPNE